MSCYDPTCKRPRGENPEKSFARWPEWLELPDTIVEHCMCGAHNRFWSVGKLLEVWGTMQRQTPYV